VANCNICNKEIEEGYICVECANAQRKQNQSATTNPTTNQKPSSGFSLNGFLKEPKPAAPDQQQPEKPGEAPLQPPPVNSQQPQTRSNNNIQAPAPNSNLNNSSPSAPHAAATPKPSAKASFQSSAHPQTPATTSEPSQPQPSQGNFSLNQSHTSSAPATPGPQQPASPTPPPAQPATNSSIQSAAPTQPEQNKAANTKQQQTPPSTSTPAPEVKPTPPPAQPVARPQAKPSVQPSEPDKPAFSLSEAAKSPAPNIGSKPEPVTANKSNSSTYKIDPENDPIRRSLKKRQKEKEEQPEPQIFDSDITGYGDEELEIAILSGIMKDNFILESLKGKGLMAGLFSTRFSRGIFRSILALRDESPDLSALDKIVIKNKLKQLNLWDSTTQKFLEKIIVETPPLLDQALHYLEMMKEQALKRKLKEVAHNITDFIDTPPTTEGENIETFTNKVIQDVRNIQKAKTTKRINLVREEMKEIVDDMDQREINGEVEIIGYSFEPMHYLNVAVSGFRKGFMYAIAGAPRRGKTTFTLELATRVATLNQIPVLFFTYEQTKKNLTYRLLAKESRLNPDTLQRKKIRSDMIADAKFAGGWKKMEEYMDYFYIVEATKEDTVDRIRSYAYNAMQDFNTDDIMIFVDYIQKMPLSRTYMDEKFKVEEISTELKGLSIELNNPIMTISSLSKDGCMIDATPDPERPTMYHCKGSGDLEYDLDCAMIQAKDWGDTKELHQQLQHKAEELGKDNTRVPKVDVVNLYLDKNRDAPEGIYSTIQYLFFIEDNKFIELGPKFDDDRFRFSKIEELVDKLIQANYIIFYDKPKDSGYNKGRVSIKLKNF
jgi:replicative DNA helicase